MKHLLSLTVGLTLGLAILGVTGCKDSESTESAAKKHQYTCSMHSDVVKDETGDCPKCGMKLVEKK